MPLPMKDRNIDENFLNEIDENPYAAAAAHYAGCLSEHEKAVKYLADEHGVDLASANEQQIGFSDRTLGKRLPTLDSHRGRSIRQRLRESGLFKTTGHETLRGYVTFPLYSEDGKVITGILGRRIDRYGKGNPVITVGEGAPKTPIIIEPHRADAEDAARSKPVESLVQDEKELIVEGDHLTFMRDDRRYRIRGLEKNTTALTLKVNVLACRDDLVYVDTLDLIKARARSSFIKAVSSELFVDPDLIKRDVGQLLFKLEALREQQIEQAKTPTAKVVELTDDQQSDALELLRDPKLLERIVADMDACGMVGESTNKLVGYLAATSRKLCEPLAIVIQSSSSAGKTSLMDAVLSMMPEEHQIRFSGITGQSLFYLDSQTIRHNILAISEDEGAAEATYALKLLQSEGELRHASVGRDSNGNMVTQHHHVEGPVQLMLTTTAMDIDEELVNRCLVLTVDESPGQTGEILSVQRSARSLDGINGTAPKQVIRTLHRNAQRLLKPLRVLNPYASQLTFPTHKTRLRRDHQKYLTLIETVALLHQYQRSKRVAAVDGKEIDYIEVEPSDIAVANDIAGEVLGRSLDELAPQTRRLLGLLHEHVTKTSKSSRVSRRAFRFTRRDVREATGWSDTQVHRHLSRLVELEYVIVHYGKHGRRFVYELLYQGEDCGGQPFLVGLVDPSKLKAPSTPRTLAG